ncbi:MbcA/ParS/Xre antitoxin family protein [Tunicatimonas pelagia]|uniref:MbcA/ParS/Xre antitoxin family protein n=1 Tax=Tunicatimonas pelagia TaxID=931531 RepID=UPI002666B0C1|nr:MbcA/ParS/Xre antitoxin family protein [Tunicatimonas pelagia]WKN45128.1 MbcA/ParS/Xre antitoxin family protein [Tunicatimonas pelagia]
MKQIQSKPPKRSRKSRARKTATPATPGGKVSWGASREEILQLARQGVSKQKVGTVMTQTQSSVEELATVLGVTVRTARNYRAQEDLLSPQQAEALLKYQKLVQRGETVFGSVEIFKRWLHKPAFGLDGDKPFDLLITSEGLNLVSDEVERIANGEFA